MKTKLVLLLLIVFSSFGYAQEILELRNPSFENPPMETLTRPFCCLGPRGWFSCGHGDDLNTPDAQPGNHGVNLDAIEGDFYIGMVTRDNETWEAVSQRLKTPLIADQEYYFSVALAQSKRLVSQSRRTQKNVSYKTPIKLRIWGGNGYCDDLEFLGETGVVSNKDWKYHDFLIKSKKEIQYITFEAFYDTPILMPYNGNILMDDLSSIIPNTPENEKLILEIQKERKAKALIAKPSVSSNYGWSRSNGNPEDVKNNVQSERAKETEKIYIKPKISSSEQKIIDARIASIQFESDKENSGPIIWNPTLKEIEGNKFEVIWEAEITEKWKLYSPSNKLHDGVMGVHLNIEDADHIKIFKKKVESEDYEIIYDEFYKTDLLSFKKEAFFSQSINVMDSSRPIFGKINYVYSHDDGTIDTKVFEFVIFVDKGEILFGR